MSGSAPDDPPPRDPKVDPKTGRRTDLGVEVTRELGGGGRLARGSGTRYSTLKFSSRGVPRDEGPPASVDDVEGERDDETPAEKEPVRAGRAPDGATATPSVADEAPVVAPKEPEPGVGLLGRVAGMLGLRGRGR